MENNKVLYNTKYLQLKATVAKNGEDWFYAHRPNAKDVVVIVPVIEKNKVLFLIEERPPMAAEGIGRYSIGLPAGLVGDVRIGETVIEAIKSELLEETGLVADSITVAAEKVASSPGCVSETFTIAIAEINKYCPVCKPNSDEGIIIDRELINIDNINSWIEQKKNDGYILTAQTLAALFCLYERTNK